MTSMNGIATTGIHHHTATVYATNVFYDDLRDNEDDVRKQSNKVKHFQTHNQLTVEACVTIL